MSSPSTGEENDVGGTTSVSSPAVADEKGIVELEACAEVDVATEPDAVNGDVAGAADTCTADGDGGEPDVDLDQIVMEAIQPDAKPEPEIILKPPPQAAAAAATTETAEPAPAVAYIQKLAPLRLGQPPGGSKTSNAHIPPRNKKSSPLLRYRSGSFGGGGKTKGSKRFEARVGRRPSPSASRTSASAVQVEEDGAANSNVEQENENEAALGMAIPLSRSMSAPSTHVGRPPKSGKSKSSWGTFRRGPSPSAVSQAALGATYDSSPSWDDGDEERQAYIDAGYSEHLSLSNSFETDEEDDNGGDSPSAYSTQSRQQVGGGYALHRVESAPISSYRHAPHSPHSPLSDDVFSFEDEDDLARSSSSSSDNSSLDSDLMAGFHQDMEMEKLAKHLAIPPHKRRRRGARGRERSFFSSSPRLSARGRSSSKGSHLDDVAEVIPLESPDDTEDRERRKMSDLDLEAGRNGGHSDKGGTEGMSPSADSIKVATFRPGVSDEAAPSSFLAVATPDEPDGIETQAENDEQPTILPHPSSIQMSASVEFFSYDPDAPLSPPPERKEAYCPTPLASNIRRGIQPSPLLLPNTKDKNSAGDSNNILPTTPTTGVVSYGDMKPSAAVTAITAAGTAMPRRQWQRRPMSSAPSVVSAADTKSTLHSVFTIITQDMFDARVLFYLSIFSIIGSILRVFIGRLFGLDCEGLDVDDVFHEGFAKVCVTASGLTEQTGGALFIDLPANMIGSTMMGIMTSGISGFPSIPWLKAEHPLQQDKAMNIAIRTGLCGSLTTFASWNSQMVVMLDGFRLPLGPQILSAIFGYIIGLQASIACFLFGRKVNMWINQCVNPHVCSEMSGYRRRGTRRSRGGAFGLFADRPKKSSRRRRGRVTNRRGSGISLDVPNDIAIPGHDDISDMARRSRRRRRPKRYAEQSPTSAAPPHTIHLPTIGDTESDVDGCCLLGLLPRWTVFPVIFVVVLFSLFVISDVLWGISFYRTLWVSTLFTPFGAILRWRLSLLNPSMKTFPLGTLIANILGSVVAILAVAIDTRYLTNEMLSAQLLAALKIGFAGSLSTVSSFVKEVVDITERYGYDAKGYKYAGITLVACCIAAVVVYSPIVRS